MALPLLNQVLVFLIDAGGVLLGAIVLLHNRKERTNQLFAVAVVLMLVWVNFAYFARVIGNANPELALSFLHVAWFVTPAFFVFLYFLVIHLARLPRAHPLLNTAVGALGAGTAYVTGFTDLVVKDIGFVGKAVQIIYGSGMFGFLAVVTVFVGVTLFLLYHGYHHFVSTEKKRLQYVFIGLTIFYTANLTFNIILPVFMGIVRWYWLGDYSTIVVLGFTGLAIVKRDLFGIRVILTALLVVLIAFLFATDILAFTEISFLQLAKTFVLIIFLYLGILLVKSVHREIMYREQLQAAYKKLEELDRTKSEFVSIASHQLRTPLTAMKGYISMILEGSYGKLDTKQKQPVESIYESNERLIRLVNDLLNVSRIESGKIEMKWEQGSVEEIIKSVVEELRIKTKEKNVELVFEEPESSLPLIRIDKEKIRNVVLNVIDNAIRYTPQGNIVVNAKYQMPSAKTPNLLISVKDTGEGMTQEEMGKLFQTFSRGGAGMKFSTEGAGLGLYIAKKFVEMHKGKIWVESQGKGQGSTFFVELPLA
jgi:signal transduction histidine kinase